jgi:hypothetical protein
MVEVLRMGFIRSLTHTKEQGTLSEASDGSTPQDPEDDKVRTIMYTTEY